MDLIIGGAYQGKLDYAKKSYSLSDSDIITCSDNKELDFTAKGIDSLEEYTLYCVRNGIDAVDEFKKHRALWQNSVIICQDIFCGVVPMGADMRAWREATGRLCNYLSAEAGSVIRMFCGLEQRLK